jgi:hypothetical protein
VLVLAVARVSVDIDDDVWSMLPCVVAGADTQRGQDAVDRLTGGLGNGADKVADSSRVGEGSCVDGSRGSKGGEDESRRELHVEMARSKGRGGEGELQRL